MTPFEAWAMKWGPECVAELQHALGCGDHAPPLAIEGQPGSEARQQSMVRLEAPKLGMWLTRNNVGALKDSRGVPVRYGLANESPEQNKVFKSSDLIGIYQRLILPQHVPPWGIKIGQFAAVEMKHEGWKYNPNDEHEAAQRKFIDFVISKGGYATFATGPQSLTQQGAA